MLSSALDVRSVRVGLTLIYVNPSLWRIITNPTTEQLLSRKSHEYVYCMLTREIIAPSRWESVHLNISGFNTTVGFIHGRTQPNLEKPRIARTVFPTYMFVIRNWADLVFLCFPDPKCVQKERVPPHPALLRYRNSHNLFLNTFLLVSFLSFWNNGY